VKGMVTLILAKTINFIYNPITYIIIVEFLEI